MSCFLHSGSLNLRCNIFLRVSVLTEENIFLHFQPAVSTIAATNRDTIVADSVSDDVSRLCEEERLIRDLQAHSIHNESDAPSKSSPIHSMTGSPRVGFVITSHTLFTSFFKHALIIHLPIWFCC